MKEKAKHAGGRPKEKVRDKVNFEVLAMLAEKGLTDIELAKVFEKDESTINRWKSDPEFSQVLKDGKQIADGKVVESLYKRALGYSHPEDKMFYDSDRGEVIVQSTIKHYPPSEVACIFWLKNRQPDKWRDRVEHTGEGGGPIVTESRMTVVKKILDLKQIEKQIGGENKNG